MRAVVIGLGNEYRHDDGVGPAVVALLRRHPVPGVGYAVSDGEPTDLIDRWTGADLAIVVDAIPGGRTPGRIHRLGITHLAPDGASAASSHRMRLGDTIELARVLDRMPRRLEIIGVEVLDTGFGIGLTPAVTAAAGHVAEELTELVGDIASAGPG